MADIRLRAHVSDAELRGRRLQDWLLHPLFWLGVALLAGLYVGMHMTALGPRYSKLVIGVVFLIVLFRFRPHVGVGLMLVLYAFPARIWIGDTNFIFTIFVLIAWLVRVAMRQEPAPRGTYLDWAVLAYVFVHILSLVNVEDQFVMGKSLLALRHLFVPILFYFVMVNVGRSERRLVFFAEMFTISMVIVFFAAFAERFFPQVRFLPSWMLTAFGSQDIFAEGGKGRVGGLFTHAMLGDATAIAFIVQIYLAIRYRHKPWARAYHWLLALVALYVVSLTRNRGSLLVLMAGSAYFLFIFNRELNWRRVLMGTIVGLALLYFGEVTLARFEGDIGLLGRLAGTYFERGIPDTRVGVWTGIWSFLVERPILGHGPYFSLRYGPLGLSVHWPHNTFLFYWFTTGILGLIAFVVIVLRVFKRTWVGRGLDVCRTPLSRGLTAVFHIAAVQFMLGQLRSDHQRGDVFVFLMWIIFAFGVMARQVWEERKRATA
ncbi:MAG: hypothetical protein GF330_09725 [Candidatus Eisenbacteria bacterium]|nr:hypothetical protein [Candidatus Eisenbacteria bacterium]